MTIEVIAFTMTLNVGQKVEYQRRHENIWPELKCALKDAGILDYSIHLDEQTNKLFAIMKRKTSHKMDDLSKTDLMQLWWTHMADIMETSGDNVPITKPLTTVFIL